MKPRLMPLVLALVLVACGQPTFAEADGQIRAYADTVQAGDLTAARTRIRNPSIDWSETTGRIIEKELTGYTLRDEVQTPIGYEATIVWQSVRGLRPYCTFVRVRKDDGTLELTKDGTFFCPTPTEGAATP